MQFPNIKSSHSFAVVTSGGTWVKARGLKYRNPFTQRVLQHTTYIRLQHLTLTCLCEFVVSVEIVFPILLKQSRWQTFKFYVFIAMSSYCVLLHKLHSNDCIIRDDTWRAKTRNQLGTLCVCVCVYLFASSLKSIKWIMQNLTATFPIVLHVCGNWFLAVRDA
jgi:succinate dehydrogenase hydrophobic anchor subunit